MGLGKFCAVSYEISTTRQRVISVRTTRLRVVLLTRMKLPKVRQNRVSSAAGR